MTNNKTNQMKIRMTKMNKLKSKSRKNTHNLILGKEYNKNTLNHNKT